MGWRDKLRRKNPSRESFRIGGIEVQSDYARDGRMAVSIAKTPGSAADRELILVMTNALYDESHRIANAGFPSQSEFTWEKIMLCSPEEYQRVRDALSRLQSKLPDAAALNAAYEKLQRLQSTAWQEHVAGKDAARMQEAEQLAGIAGAFFAEKKGLPLDDAEKSELTERLAEHLKQKGRRGPF
ncbi:MAG: hypothetical protein AB7L92_00620 [Alphaproteobacteria bacterium]